MNIYSNGLHNNDGAGINFNNNYSECFEFYQRISYIESFHTISAPFNNTKICSKKSSKKSKNVNKCKKMSKK